MLATLQTVTLQLLKRQSQALTLEKYKIKLSFDFQHINPNTLLRNPALGIARRYVQIEMIKSRKQILELNPAFTEFILNLQLLDKPDAYDEGQKIFLSLEDEKGIILTKELADKFNKEELEEFENSKDSNPFPNFEKIKFIGNGKYISSKKETTEYLTDLAKVLETIRIQLNETELIILGTQSCPWLNQDNDYPPVKRAINYISKHIDADFTGGFQIKEKEFIEFIPHFFWLTRCNASITYFFMSFPKSQTIISICKDGALHFEFYNQSEKQEILKVLTAMNFKTTDYCNSPIEFDNFEGRKIKISN